MMLENLLTFLRILVYLWAMAETLVTAYLYWEALKMMKKKSKMIEAIINLFAAITANFMLMALVVLTRVIDKDLFFDVTQLVFIPVIFVGFYVRKFRYWTIHTPPEGKVTLDKEINKLKEDRLRQDHGELKGE